MNVEQRAWVLNLDAEHELEAGAGYAPTRHLRAIVARESQRLQDNLVRPGDVVLTEGEVRPGMASGLRGACWSPTPRALALLETAGAVAGTVPAFESLRAVNARPFAAYVRAPFARASFAKNVAATLEEALALLAVPGTAAGWLVRRSYGAAGRGRRRLAAGRPTEDEQRWLIASLRRGALVIEPWVEVTREYTRNGWVHADGRVDVLAPGLQETTRAGAWIRTEAAHPGDVRHDDARLAEAAAAAGAALARAGYFGPFGVDAFRHRSLSSRGPREVLNPLSEINARYTMDWNG